MKTKKLLISREAIDLLKIKQAANIIKNNGVVAFPTETVYGLGANGLSSAAVNKIFQAKGRPADNPLILHIANLAELDALVMDIPNDAQKVMEHFWPGPLTVVLKRKDHIPDNVTAGLSTVAIRMPSDQVALKLIEYSGFPIAAPSANLSGKPSPTEALAVLEDLDGKIDAVIDAGPVDVGLESTVLDCSGEKLVILRPGKITKEDLELFLNKPVLISEHYQEDDKPKAPGMKYKHYSPKASVYVFYSEDDLMRVINNKVASSIKIGVMADEKILANLSNDIIKLGCDYKKLDDLAKHLYSWLRCFDEKKVDVIFAMGVERKDLGRAIMNRLDKAAGFKSITDF